MLRLVGRLRISGLDRRLAQCQVAALARWSMPLRSSSSQEGTSSPEGGLQNTLVEFRAPGRKFGLLRGLVVNRQQPKPAALPAAALGKKKATGPPSSLVSAISARQQASTTYLSMGQRDNVSLEPAAGAAAAMNASWAMVEDLETSAAHKLHRHAITFAFLHEPKDKEDAKALVSLVTSYYDAFCAVCMHPEVRSSLRRVVSEYLSSGAKKGDGDGGQGGQLVRGSGARKAGVTVDALVAQLLLFLQRDSDLAQRLVQSRLRVCQVLNPRTVDTYVVRRWIGEAEGGRDFEASMSSAGAGAVPHLLIRLKAIGEPLQVEQEEASNRRASRRKLVQAARQTLSAKGKTNGREPFKASKELGIALAQVKAYALRAADRYEEVNREVLEPLGYGNRGRDAYQLLRDLGIWRSDRSPFYFALSEEGYGRPVSPQYNHQVEMLKSSLPVDPLQERRTYVSDPAYAIDPVDAESLDDAVSLGDKGVVPPTSKKGTPGAPCQWVHIHVTDISRYIAPDTPIDRVARRLGENAVLKEASMSIFPLATVRSLLSFTEERASPSLSFAALVEDSTGAVVDYKAYPSLVGNIRRMTYREANSALTSAKHPEHSNLIKLQTITNKVSSWRQALAGKGADGLPDTIREDATLADGSASSFMVIREMMLLAGAVAGQVAADYNLPMCYSVRDSHHRGYSAVPGAHGPLGFAAYAQSTSPLRRYVDYINHIQIKGAILRERPFFTAAKVEEILHSWAGRTNIKLAEAGSRRYWQLLEVEKNTKALYEAKVVRLHRNQGEWAQRTAHVMLQTKEGVPGTVKVDPRYSVGDVISLRVLKVDAYDGVLELAIVKEPSQKPRPKRAAPSPAPAAATAAATSAAASQPNAPTEESSPTLPRRKRRGRPRKSVSENPTEAAVGEGSKP